MEWTQRGGEKVTERARGVGKSIQEPIDRQSRKGRPTWYEAQERGAQGD